jgi:hypothetical protein
VTRDGVGRHLNHRGADFKDEAGIVHLHAGNGPQIFQLHLQPERLEESQLAEAVLDIGKGLSFTGAATHPPAGVGLDFGQALQIAQKAEAGDQGKGVLGWNAPTGGGSRHRGDQ